MIRPVFSESSTLKYRFYNPLFKLIDEIPESLMEMVINLKLNWSKITDKPKENCNVFLSESIRIAKYLTIYL